MEEKRNGISYAPAELDKREMLRDEDPMELYDMMLDVLTNEEVERIAASIIEAQRSLADELWFNYDVLKDDIDDTIETILSGKGHKPAKLRMARNLGDKARQALAAALDAEQRYDTLVERYGGGHADAEEEVHG